VDYNNIKLLERLRSLSSTRETDIGEFHDRLNYLDHP